MYARSPHDRSRHQGAPGSEDSALMQESVRVSSHLQEKEHG